MNIDYTFYLTVCGLLVLLLTLLGAESDLKTADETKAPPLVEGPPASRAFGWSRFAGVTCVTLLVAVLTSGTVGFWSVVRAGQWDEGVAALPVSLLWVASLFLLLNVIKCGAGVQND